MSRFDLQHAMTSSEERTSAESRGLPHREVTDGLKGGDAIHQCPRADSWLLRGIFASYIIFSILALASAFHLEHVLSNVCMLLCTVKHTQQNSWPHLQWTELHPPFFSTGALHFGQSCEMTGIITARVSINRRYAGCRSERTLTEEHRRGSSISVLEQIVGC